MNTKDLSPIELLNRIHSDLSKLKGNAFLFGRGAELDIKKANILINFAMESLESLKTDKDPYNNETPLGLEIDGYNNEE